MCFICIGKPIKNCMPGLISIFALLCSGTEIAISSSVTVQSLGKREKEWAQDCKLKSYTSIWNNTEGMKSSCPRGLCGQWRILTYKTVISVVDKHTLFYKISFHYPPCRVTESVTVENRGVPWHWWGFPVVFLECGWQGFPAIGEGRLWAIYLMLRRDVIISAL